MGGHAFFLAPFCRRRRLVFFYLFVCVLVLFFLRYRRRRLFTVRRDGDVATLMLSCLITLDSADSRGIDSSSSSLAAISLDSYLSFGKRGFLFLFENRQMMLAFLARAGRRQHDDY